MPGNPEGSYSPAISGAGPPFRVIKAQTVIDGVPTIVDLEVVAIADKDGNLADYASPPLSIKLLRDIRRLLKRIKRETVGARVTKAFAGIVAEQGTIMFVSGQAAPTATATQLVVAHPTRRTVLLLNIGTVDVFVGPQGVTITNGFKLGPGASVTLGTVTNIFGITASGTGAIHFIEELD